MESPGNIVVTIIGKSEGGQLNPKDIDITETKELLSDVETLLFPVKAERDERPKVSYEVQEGSIKNIFYLPVAKAIMFTALMTEVGKQGSVDILDTRAASILDKWQRKAYDSGREYNFSSSVSPDKSFLNINKQTEFIMAQSSWVDINLYLYGKIYEEGGLQKVNLHILTDRYGRLTVKATEEQLTEGDNKLFKVYGLWVKGKQDLNTGEFKNLELIDYLNYQPDYDDLSLKKLIDKASLNWKSIKDKDAWLGEIRGGVDG
jgi:hypothetical protein